MKLKNSTVALAALAACCVPVGIGCGSSEGDSGLTSEPAAATGGAASGTLTLQSDWGSGYCANVTIKNTGTSATTTWTAVVNLNQSTISSLWSASDTVSGSTLTATALSWNAALAPGASTTWGFCANATGTNYHPSFVSVSVNGIAASSSSTTTTTTTTSSSSKSTSTSTSPSTSSSSHTTSSSSSTTTTSSSVVTTSSSSSKTSTSTSTSSRSTSTSTSTSSSSASSSSSSSMAGGCPAPQGSQTGGTQFCSNSIGNTAGGYSYQLWSSGQGTGCMTVFGTDATYKANWSAAGDFLARVGLGFNESQTPSTIGTLGADFAETKSGTAGYSSIGIYGWSVNPLHEYYIVEDWFGSTTPVDGTKMGTITVDGGTYTVYTHTMTNAPTITGGNATFVQFLSVRTTPRQCGHISISEHFSQWAALGMQLGDLEEARILVEAGGNATGNIDFTAADVTLTQ